MFNLLMVFDMKLTVSFYLRSNHLTKKGEHPVMLRVSYLGERLNFGSIGLSLPLDYEIKSNRVVRFGGSSAGVCSYNKILLHIEFKLHSLFDHLQEQGTFSLSRLKSLFMSNETDKPVSLADSFVRQRSFLRKSNQGHHLAMEKHMSVYLWAHYNKEDILIKHIDTDFVCGFYRFLQKRLALRTSNEYFRYFKSTYMRAVKEHRLIVDNPFSEVTIHHAKSTRGYLTEEELTKISQAKLTDERLIKARDYFLFACFSGLAYTDVRSLEKKHLRQINGHLWIQKEREKTNVLSNVFVLSKAKDILEKYMRDNSSLVFPDLPPLGTLLNHLKRLSEICNIRKVTFHLGRHTFATMALSKGVSIESVSKVLGHTNISTTQIYAKIINKKIELELLDFEGKISSHF